MRQSENIFIHNLTEEMSGILFGFKGKAKILWIIWGTDLYDYLPINLYDHYTLKLKDKLDNNLLSMLIRFYYSFWYNIRKLVIKNLDYVISAHSGDVKLLKKYFKTKAECYSKLIYINPIDFENEVGIIDEKFNFKKNGTKFLLLGNSGTPTNNHLDIMIRLSKMKEQNFEIICPLSYGNPIYITKIVEKGKMLFGDRFVPLLEFLNPDIYIKILKQIDLAVMYHNRTQGLGTIRVILCLGKPVCMKKTSAFFHLVEKGVSIFPPEDLEGLILNEIELTEAMAKNNKKIILQNYSVKSTISSIKNLFNILEDINH